MRPFALSSLVALIASLALTAAVRSLAKRWGVMDQPDGRRKLHGRPVPLWGGIAVYGATVLGLLAALFSPGGANGEFIELSLAWMIAAGLVCFVGGIDDRYDLPSRVKLILQIVSVLPIVLCGYYVDRVVAFGYPIELGWLGIPLTVLWLVGCINALNLIDGMDGLASLVGLSAAIMMGVIAANEGHPHVAVMAMVLTSSLLGFLMYNLPPASVFLGDSGSMVIGLSLGLLGIQGALKTTATLAITAPAVVMTLPIFDILAAVVRRKLTGRRIDAPDRLHIHHRLLDRGWSPWQVLCLIGAICLTTGAAATAATIFRLDVLAWVTAMTLVVLMIRLRLFGYEEFALVKWSIVKAAKSAFAMIGKRENLVIWRFGDLVIDRQPDTFRKQRSLQISKCPPLSWDAFLENIKPWNVQQVEFRSTEGQRSRKIRWTNPTAHEMEEDDFGWSLSVSLPGKHGEQCELRTTRKKPIVGNSDRKAFVSLLKTFGNSFASDVDRLFGPRPAEATQHRKAA
jgi:UDP-GlcNAc:undecaprenyl-phosphate/decaprenyl-phosphate GlcNAc-1-phosphate transferase